MPGDFENHLHPALQSPNTCRLPGNQWYFPALAGAGTFAQHLFRGDVYKGVLDVLESLGKDAYAEFISTFVGRGLQAHGSRWRYADICTVLYALSRVIGVRDYLEIGVRRGRSMAMVVSGCPSASVTGFDMWMEDYAGMENPGPDFVAGEMQRLGHKGRLEFVSGDSHQTVPDWFEKHPDAFYDMITVDGDHSEVGARADLLTVISRLRIGGVLVFDDIAHPSHPYLSDVWQKTIAARSDFSSFEFTELGYGVAFGVRMS